MARPTKSVATMSMKMSKAEIQARTEMEAKVQEMAPKKPKPTIELSKEERKIFNRFVKLNDNFNEADATSLTILTRSLHRYLLLNDELNGLDPLDEQTVSLERRIHAYDKVIIQHMTLLCIPLNQRLRMANDMAKVEIEQKKLEQMNGIKPQEVNPLMALLQKENK
ncbi:hypothetical protein ABEY41_19150 [Peribacillus butanolivorans]|uniref:hypothetical protein n=1 Tax=Peribacillus butanolivorans TaxID=421767 RepID=UPI003D275941